MASIPYMPFFVADYLADTIHLTTIEHGAYLLLIMHYWQTGKPIPNNDELLKKITRIHGNCWRKVRENILNMFAMHDDFLYHKRIEMELERYRAKSDAARAAINKRWEKNKANSEGKNDTDVLRTYYGCNTNRTEQNRTDNNILETTNVVSVDSQLSTIECPHGDIIKIYHEMLPECPQVKKWDGKRQVWLRARWREDKAHQSLDFWRAYFGFVRQSDFLMGRTEPAAGRRVFLANLEWLVKADNFTKVQEGRYS